MDAQRIGIEPVPKSCSRGEVVEFVAREGGLARPRIGRVELTGRRAMVEVPADWAERLARLLDGRQLGGGRVRAWVEAAQAPHATGDHFQRLLHLLDLEAQAERERVIERARRSTPQRAEQTGESLVDLAADDVYPGLGGRMLVALVKRNRTLGLPWTRLSVGSPVVLSPQGPNEALSLRGVIAEKSARGVNVAVGELPDEFDQYDVWRIDLSSDEVARERQRIALAQARSASAGRVAELRDVCLALRTPRVGNIEPFDPLDAALDDSQREAVAVALAAADVAIIHGPPGTGKTTALVEVIRQSVARGEKVLATAASNLAVDHLMARLVAAGVNAVRLGHPARVVATMRERTLDQLVEEHDDAALARRLLRDAVSLRRKAARYTRAKPEPGERGRMREEARQLAIDARRLEQQAVEQILDGAEVLCATLTGLDSLLLGGRRFDLAAIDEAGQATEPPCWIPLLLADKLVLAGDHQQLPPTVVSAKAAAGGLGVSLMERLTLSAETVTRMLTVQYRMHESIMGFSSQEFYEARLQAHESVAGHRLADLAGVASDMLTSEPLLFLDTAGASYAEEVEPDGASLLNRQEADLAERTVRRLEAAGLEAADIALIAPYAAQVRLLSERLRDLVDLEVDTVDGFQGREKEAVVVSLVRSNTEGDVGFLADTRRMNVALTRARRKLIVIGDSATLGGHPFYGRLLEYFESCGAYHTVWEEIV